jgi:hypothetical protein
MTQRARCPVCRQIITGTLRVYAVTQDERKRIADSHLSDLHAISDRLKAEQQAAEEASLRLKKEQQAAEEASLRLKRELELVNASRARKRAVLNADPGIVLRTGNKARDKMLKKNAGINRCLPERIHTLITTVDADGGYYTQCEESALLHKDLAVVIGITGYANTLVAQGEVIVRTNGSRTVGGVIYAHWYTCGNPHVFLRYVRD